MRAIISVLISYVCFYMAKSFKSGKDTNKIKGFFALLSCIFLIASVVFMIIGI